MWTWIKALFTRYALLEQRMTKAENRIEHELSFRSVRRCLACGCLKFFVSKSTERMSEPYQGKKTRMGFDRTYTCKECGFSETYNEHSKYPDN